MSGPVDGRPLNVFLVTWPPSARHPGHTGSAADSADKADEVASNGTLEAGSCDDIPSVVRLALMYPAMYVSDYGTSVEATVSRK